MTAALITGASGFIARQLAKLVRAGRAARTVGADIRAVPTTLFDECFAVDLTDAAATLRVVESVSPSVVYHLVGGIRGSDEFIHASNVVTARNIIDATRKVAPGARVVLVGSAAEYGAVPLAEQPVRETLGGAPSTAYGQAKAQVSSLATAARDRGQTVMVARPFNVIGAGVPDALVGGAIVHRLRAALAGPAPRSIRIGRTSGVRDFVAVEDVARGIVQIGERGRPGEAYNLCTGEGHTIAELLDRLLALVGEEIVVERDESLLRPGEVDAMIGSFEKAREELGWRPTVSFDDSVRAAWLAAELGVAP